jgi:hypothetical protein
MHCGIQEIDDVHCVVWFEEVSIGGAVYPGKSLRLSLERF